MKNKLPNDQMQEHTHPVETAKEVTTQHTCCGMAQMRLKDPKKNKTEKPSNSTDKSYKPGTSTQTPHFQFSRIP